MLRSAHVSLHAACLTQVPRLLEGSDCRYLYEPTDAHQQRGVTHNVHPRLVRARRTGPEREREAAIARLMASLATMKQLTDVADWSREFCEAGREFS